MADTHGVDIAHAACLLIVDTFTYKVVMHTQAVLQKWGNSIALRLSGNLKTIPHFEAGDTVDIEMSEQGLVTQKAHKKRFRESDLLMGLTAYTAHADDLAAPIAGELDY
ncbi:transcriptional regulator [Sodalis sp. RH14]|uniref:AbrB/MazE/SpoVT family DNA-binding domain-containing protein n=2 Tax=unclassified Sodalis (in: enterobacteria) TaxID=2636512 RepID=UPI0039B4AE6E